MTKTPQPYNNFAIFTTPTGKVNIDVLFENETLRLTQKKMAELLDTTTQNITLHLKNIYASWELVEKGTCKDFLQVQEEGSRVMKRKMER